MNTFLLFLTVAVLNLSIFFLSKGMDSLKQRIEALEKNQTVFMDAINKNQKIKKK